MITENEKNYILLARRGHRYSVEKVSEIIYSDIALTNALRIGKYPVDIVRGVSGNTYTNVCPRGDYYDRETHARLPIEGCDYCGVMIMSENDLKEMITKKISENENSISDLTAENESLRDVLFVINHE